VVYLGYFAISIYFHCFHWHFSSSRCYARVICLEEHIWARPLRSSPSSFHHHRRLGI
jgi:hypothetical protein